MENFYITTTLPYVNAAPHLGFAWEIVTADIIARFERLQGKRVIFNTGSDEHGQKIFQKAAELNMLPQAYTDKMAQPFKDLRESLGLSWTNFIRTTDENHVAAAQEFWRRCFENGDIYKKKYKVKYCVGCEMEKTESELIDGHCPLHPNQDLEEREEDNYFFRFSRYQDKLLNLYAQNPDFVRGEGKMNELKSFVSRGLQDFSISRVRKKMPWGIPVPDDDEQVMYVWFDALVNYISTLGWPEADADWQEFWPGWQICGKDNLRQQAAMWQAMLMSAGLPTSKGILVNGFITVDGQKMSKSLGNVISPDDLIALYGREPTRFLLAGLPVLSGDADITSGRLYDFYTANLTNGLGNLASRLAKLASTCHTRWQLPAVKNCSAALQRAMSRFDTSGALNVLINEVATLDKKLSEQKPWLIKDVPQKIKVLEALLASLRVIIFELQIFMPETAAKLAEHFDQEEIAPLQPLFPRLAKPE